MTSEQVAVFADKKAVINERTQVTYKNNEVDSGYFFNNKYSTIRQDNLWNFVVMKSNVSENITKVINGDDIVSIKTIQLY